VFSVLESKVPPPIVMLAVGGIMWAIEAVTRFATLRTGIPSALALAVAVLGVLVEAAGAYEFARAHTTVDPTHPASASTLVTEGVYRFTRNPMYLGDMVLLVAWGLYLSNPFALAAAWLFVAYIDRFQIRAEERALRSLFGGVYEDFCARVRRWV